MLKLFKTWRFPLALLLAAIAWAAALHKGLPEHAGLKPQQELQLSAATQQPSMQPSAAATAERPKAPNASLPAAEQLMLLLARHHKLAEKAVPLGDERAEL